MLIDNSALYYEREDLEKPSKAQQDDPLLQINLMHLPKKGGDEGSVLQNSNNRGELFQGQEITEELLEKSKFFLYFHDDQNGFTEETFMDYVYTFDIQREVTFNRDCAEYKKQQSTVLKKASYACNLKLASMRLGDTMLWISRHESKTKNLLNVAYISAQPFGNPNKHSLTVFLFCYDKNKRRFLTEDWKRHQSIILTQIEPYMSKDNLFNGHEKGNHLYIFDLKRLPSTKSAMEYEFSYDPQNSDIQLKKKGIKNYAKKYLINKLPDYSLTSYIKYLYLTKPKIQVYLNDNKVDFEAYTEFLDSQKEKLLPFNISEQYKEFSDCGKFRIFRVNDSPLQEPQSSKFF